MKRILSLALVLVMVISTVAALSIGTSAEENIASDTPVSLPAFDTSLDVSGPKNAMQVNPGSTYGIRLNVGAPFDGFSYCLPTWNTTDSTCDLVLYQWDTDYETTVAKTPVYSEHLDTVKDCQGHGISFNDQPAGEYFFAIQNVKGQIGTWSFERKVGNGFAYMDGTESAVDLQIKVNFTKTPVTAFLPLASVSEVDGNHKVPAQPEITGIRDVMSDTWVFTDSIGRVSLTNADVGDVKENPTTVSMFFWDWHIDNLCAGNPVNVQKLSELYPEAMHDYYNAIWSDHNIVPSNPVFYWNEPIYGYYRSDDEWVLRRQAELLTNAGVDAILFDNTNGNFTWKNAYKVIYPTFEQARKDGVMAPYISFMLPFGANDGSKDQVENLYLDIYRKNKYQDLWFYVDEKPLLMGHLDNFALNTPIGKEVLYFFTVRRNQPSYVVKNTSRNNWGWLSTYPQALYYSSAADKKNNIIDQTTVGASLNHSYITDSMIPMNYEGVMDRSYSHALGGYDPRGAIYGACLQEQFDYVFDLQKENTVRHLLVTGWNEWTAGRHEVWCDLPNAFPDEFNDAASRDIEPTKGALGDAFYYQLVNNLRKLNGVRPIPTPSGAVTIDLAGNANQWDNIAPRYLTYIGNTGDRDHKGNGSLVYTETSGRNDLAGAQIARDNDYVYVRVECASDITASTDDLWMNIYLDTDQTNAGWETFDYVINKTKPNGNKAVLEKFTGAGDNKYDSEKVGEVDFTVDGKYLTVKIPKSMLGLSGYDWTVNLTVTDNVHDEGDYTKFSGDIMNFYISGDVAPSGRFKYSYISTTENAAAGADTTPATTPATETSATEAPNTEAPTTTDTNTGCGSVVSGVAILLVALSGLTACALRKKED